MASQGLDMDHVVINLTATGDIAENFSHPERSIRLSREQNILKIGRVSQVEAKGFVATNSNGWFDSPVMSRHHAEIKADIDAKSVQITDTSSLHGTYLNGNSERMPTEHPYDLVDGDVLRFGTEISRKADTFQPATLRLGIKFPTKKSLEPRGSSFHAPEFVDDGLSTDDEDDVGVDAQDVHKTEPIDLTDDTDEPVEAQSRSYMDLTSPTRSPSIDLEDDGDLRQPAAIVAGDANVLRRERTDRSQQDFPAHSSSILQSGYTAAAPSSQTLKITPDAPSPYEDSIDLDSYSDDLPNEDSEDIGSSSESSDSEEGAISETDSKIELLLDNRSEFDDDSDEDEERQLGYGFIVEDEELSDDMDNLDDIEYGRMRLAAAKTPSGTHQHLDTVKPMDISMTSPVQQVVVPVASPGLAHPRPSAYNIESILNPSDRQPSPYPAGTLSAQKLGAQLGNSEFFVARAANKTNFVPSEVPGHILTSDVPASHISTFAPAMTPAVAKPAEVTAQETSPCGPNVANKDETMYSSAAKTLPKPQQVAYPADTKLDFELAKSSLLDAGAKFLATPFHDNDHPEDISDAAGEDPMQSAAVFQQHKLSSGAADVNKEPVYSLKRKAEKMSGSDENKAGLPAVLRTATPEPPAKRKATVAAKRKVKSTTRAVVENIGIAALGGAVVLTSLIFSAPAL